MALQWHLRALGGDVVLVASVFPPDPDSAPAARRFLRRELASCGVDASLPELLLGELAANAIVHAQTPFTVRVALNGNLRVEVTDGDPTIPARGPVSPERDQGRGLQIVDELADAWGVEHVVNGKTVWFEVATSRPGPA